jgi:hypothetical protein
VASSSPREAFSPSGAAAGPARAPQAKVFIGGSFPRCSRAGGAHDTQLQACCAHGMPARRLAGAAGAIGWHARTAPQRPPATRARALRRGQLRRRPRAAATARAARAPAGCPRRLAAGGAGRQPGVKCMSKRPRDRAPRPSCPRIGHRLPPLSPRRVIMADGRRQAARLLRKLGIRAGSVRQVGMQAPRASGAPGLRWTAAVRRAHSSPQGVGCKWPPPTQAAAHRPPPSSAAPSCPVRPPPPARRPARRARPPSRPLVIGPRHPPPTPPPPPLLQL